MRNHLKFRRSLFAASLVALFAAAPLTQVMAQDPGGGMQKSSDNQTVPDKAADAWITTKVKSELASTKGIKSTEISVSTNDGVVTLTGSIPTAKEKAKAVRVAKHVKGVKSVESSSLNVGAAEQ